MVAVVVVVVVVTVVVMVAAVGAFAKKIAKFRVNLMESNEKKGRFP